MFEKIGFFTQMLLILAIFTNYFLTSIPAEQRILNILVMSIPYIIIRVSTIMEKENE